jgi:hypothetical protein
MRRHHHEFDASVGASGPHGFAVRKTSFVGIEKRMLRCLAATASRLHVRDDREASLFMRRDVRQMKLICPEDKAQLFLREGWPGRIRLMRLAKSVFESSGIACATDASHGLPRRF